MNTLNFLKIEIIDILKFSIYKLIKYFIQFKIYSKKLLYYSTFNFNYIKK